VIVITYNFIRVLFVVPLIYSDRFYHKGYEHKKKRSLYIRYSFKKYNSYWSFVVPQSSMKNL